MPAWTRDNVFLQQDTSPDCLSWIRAQSADLIVTDPPWLSGTIRSAAAGTYDDRFAGEEGFKAYKSMIRSVVCHSFALLKPTGTLAMWLDYRAAPYAMIAADEIFGRDQRVGEIICHSELGNPGKKHWPVKHSTIMLVAHEEKNQYFKHDALPTVKRVGLGSDQRPINSVLPTTLSNTDGERVGYPDQKPSWVYSLLVEAFVPPGGMAIDPFAGSGTLGAAVQGTDKFAWLIDRSPEACACICKRLDLQPVEE